MFPDSQMCFFSNVHISIRDKVTNRNIKELHKKNRITKYALNGIASMIKGEFNNTNYAEINDYVPKYLALGTNDASNDPGTDVGVSVTAQDTSLLSEITSSNGSLKRIRLERVVRDDSSRSNDYIKISYKAMVTSGTISTDTTIQELGLFVDNTSKSSGLWARITVEPITIPDNSILDVTWDIVLASSGIGIYPTKVELYNNDTKVDYTTVTVPYGYVSIVSSKLYSSIVDGASNVTAIFYTRTETSGTTTTYISTNNFNNIENYVKVEKISDSLWKVSKKENVDGTYTEITGSPFSSSETAHEKAIESVETSTDFEGNIVTNGTEASVKTYKEVTYQNINWGLLYNDVIVNGYDGTQTYNVGDVVTKDNGFYRCKTNSTTGVWDSTKWDKIFNFVKYMTTVAFTNTNTVVADGLTVTLTAKAITGINTKVNYTFSKQI